MKNNFCAFCVFILALIFLSHLALAESVLKVGWIGPLTGDSAVVGIDSATVTKQVFDDFNKNLRDGNTKIRLFVEDDQYLAAKTVAAYNKLVKVEGVKIIFVLTYGGLIAISQQAERDGVLLINTLDCDDELAALPRNSFCVAKRTEDLGVINAKHALDHKNLPAGIIYFNSDPFMPKVAKSTHDFLRTHGSEPLVYEGAAGNTDLRAILTRVKDKNVRSLFIYGYDSFGVGMKQARQLGISAAFYSLTNINSPGFKASAGESINGTNAAGWFAPRNDRYSKFISAYTARTGHAPLLELALIPTYDMATILTLGLTEISKDNALELNINSLRDYLYRIKDYEGLSGKITMDPDGAVRSFTVGSYSFDHGNFKEEQYSKRN